MLSGLFFTIIKNGFFRSKCQLKKKQTALSWNLNQFENNVGTNDEWFFSFKFKKQFSKSTKC
jgi:hypothetical protein